MVIRKFSTRLALAIQPIWHTEPPLIRVAIDDHELYHDHLREFSTIEFSKQLPVRDYVLTLEFLNKKDSDTQGNLDKAVVIKSLSFMDIVSDNFIWQGLYTPTYPEPWATQQREAGNPPQPTLRHQTRLSWNGKWQVRFTVPIFTWIHQVENLGWIYSVDQ